MTGSDPLAIVQAGDTKQLPVTAITGYARTAAEIAASVTPTAYQHPPGDVRRYGVTGDGSTDDTSTLQNAFNSGESVRVPAGLSVRTTNTVSFIGSRSLMFEGDSHILYAGSADR
jgi:hypothetical protein